MYPACCTSCHVPPSCHVPSLLYVLSCPLYPRPVVSIVPLSCHVPGLLYPHPVMSIVPPSCHVPSLLTSCHVPGLLYLRPVMSIVPPSCHDHGPLYPRPAMTMAHCAPVLVSLPSTPNPGLQGKSGLVHHGNGPQVIQVGVTGFPQCIPCVSQGKNANALGKWMHFHGFSPCKGSPDVQNIHF